LTELVKVDEAIVLLQKAIASDPNEAKAHSNLGSAWRAKGREEEAIACYRQAIKIDPGLVPPRYNLGMHLNAAADADEAIECLRVAVQHDPNLPGAQNRLGTLLSDRKHDYARAIAAFREAVRIDPTSAETNFNLGLNLRFNGDYEAAIPVFREAIKLKPDYARALINLSRCLTLCNDAELRNSPEAMQVAEAGVKLLPQSELSWIALGWAQYRRGDWQKAIASIDKSIALQKAAPGGNARQWFLLAMAHAKNGDRETAQRHFERAKSWMDQHAPKDPELQRIRPEAEELIGKTSRDRPPADPTTPSRP
jgi:tetratricopeptide (TPR) repeat protein